MVHNNIERIGALLHGEPYCAGGLLDHCMETEYETIEWTSNVWLSDGYIPNDRLEEYYSKLLGKDFDREYDGFVCRDNFGKLITPNFVTSHFKYIIKKNKLKHIRFHDLRHSCASLLLANGVSMKAIQEWLGHSTFNVTANFYSHLDFHSKVESAETIAKVLGGDSADTEQAIHDKGSEGKKSRKSSTWEPAIMVCRCVYLFYHGGIIKSKKS